MNVEQRFTVGRRHSGGSSRGAEHIVAAYLRSISVYMANPPCPLCPLITENELQKAIPLTPRKITKLRLLGLLPVVKVDRRTRLYSLERVVAALEKLEIKTK
jgi:hypothetical protein